MDSLYNFLCSENDIFLCYYFLDKLNNYNNNKILIYKNVLMKNAIKIDDDFLVFKSNKVASKGMSQLLLYNFRVKKDIFVQYKMFLQINFKRREIKYSKIIFGNFILNYY